MRLSPAAAIALENTRRERRYRETQMALAHVNRVATMRTVIIAPTSSSSARVQPFTDTQIDFTTDFAAQALA